jgi:hypothetical protein
VLGKANEWVDEVSAGVWDLLGVVLCKSIFPFAS